ncbi:MAG: hypothetical protein QJR02_08225 [Sinobacteraceae bacterium]|nr:hypothetical protein [Nevskiaceae bacterium]
MFSGIAAWAASVLGGVGGKLLEIIVGLALLLVLVGGPYWLGLRHARTECELAQARAQVAAQVAAQSAQAKQEAISTRSAAQATTQIERERAHTRTLVKEVTRYVHDTIPAPPGAAGCGLDADGLRIWRSANAGADAAADASGAADGAMPGAPSAGQPDAH